MEHTLLSFIQSAGVDTKNALPRFAGNADLYIKFLRRFPQDNTFDQIQTALSQEDWRGMLNAAHTLKGVAGNLGMGRLFQACSETVCLLRESNPAAAKKSYAELEAAYRAVVSVLHQWEENENEP